MRHEQNRSDYTSRAIVIISSNSYSASYHLDDSRAEKNPIGQRVIIKLNVALDLLKPIQSS